MPDPQLTPEELDRLIDGLLDGSDAPQGATTARDGYALMHTARDVRSLADEPVPTAVRDRHLAAIRAAAADHAPAASTGRTGWMSTLRRRAAAIAAATSLAFSATGGGAVALAQDANPGDPLYGVKRVSENVALAVTNDDARLHLSFAERRLDELEAVPDRAPQLADEAAQQLQLAQEGGADLSEAGVNAVERLSQVVGRLAEGDASENAVIAVSRACDRIATRHGHDPSACGYDGESQPGGSGDAPGRSGDTNGRSGDAPGRSGDAPGRSDDAPTGRDDADTDGDGTRPDGAGPPDGAPGSGSEPDPAG